MMPFANHCPVACYPTSTRKGGRQYIKEMFILSHTPEGSPLPLLLPVCCNNPLFSTIQFLTTSTPAPLPKNFLSTEAFNQTVRWNKDVSRSYGNQEHPLINEDGAL